MYQNSVWHQSQMYSGALFSVENEKHKGTESMHSEYKKTVPVPTSLPSSR